MGFLVVWLGQPGMVGLGVWVFGFFLETFRDFGVLGVWVFEIWNFEALFLTIKMKMIYISSLRRNLPHGCTCKLLL